MPTVFGSKSSEGRIFNPIALRMAKTHLSFGHSKGNRVDKGGLNSKILFNMISSSTRCQEGTS